MQQKITRDRVVGSFQDLPAFPSVVLSLLAAIEDPESTLDLIVDIVEADPALTGNVMFHANKVGNATRQVTVDGVRQAVFLLGLARVREIALTLKLFGFVDGLRQAQAKDASVLHRVLVSASGLELANCAPLAINVDAAVIACLLHDIGQSWLERFEPILMQQVSNQVASKSLDVLDAERAVFGIDHGLIGGWLSQLWGLPTGISEAITHGHAPNIALKEPLVAVVHVAKAIGSALAMDSSPLHRVTHVSSSACAVLGQDWGPDTAQLFGRIEGRAHHTMRLLAGDREIQSPKATNLPVSITSPR
jgi:HD-like signal output (HDOD) protein